MIAAHRDECSPSWSTTIRTARARTSGENLLLVCFVMAPPSQELEPPINPGRFIKDDSSNGTCSPLVDLITSARTRFITEPISRPGVMDAYNNPDFYRQLGRHPEQLTAAALELLAKKFSL